MAHHQPQQQVAPGAYVIIDGLQSDTGRKLNGGKGIILDNSASCITSNDAVHRYPVLVYALKDSTTGNLKVLQPTTNRKIKAENLKVDPTDPEENELLQDIALHEVLRVQTSLQMGQREVDSFWVHQYYVTNPGSFEAAITYANILRHVRKFEDALRIVEKHEPLEDYVQPSDPRYPSKCYDYSVVRIVAETQMDLALEYALKIPTDVPQSESSQMAIECLTLIAGTCNKLLHENANFENAQLSDVHTRASQAILEREPGNVNAAIELASAYCLGGNNLEGARQYRRGLAMAKIQHHHLDVKEHTGNLVLAQLACPGMPLEHHFVIGVSRTHVFCIHKQDRSKWDIVRSVDGNQQTTLMTAAAERGCTFQSYDLPSRPEDARFFPEQFLATVQ